MPNRILREGILTSASVSTLGWPEEVFYRRLHSVVDDFGRYFADPGLLRAACYPRQLNKVSDSDIEKWTDVCAKAALVRVYLASDGERYLEVVRFSQQVRAKRSRFPEMPSECLADATHVTRKRDPPAQQVQSNAPVFVSVSEDVSVVDTPPSGSPQKPPPWVLPAWVPPKEWADFETMRKAMRGVPFTDAARDGVVRELAKFKAKGHDTATLLTTAVTSGHRTVFEPKPGNGSYGLSAKEREAEKTRARLREGTSGILGNPPTEQPPKEVLDVPAKRLD